MVQPRRIREGPACAEHDSGGSGQRGAAPRQDDHRCNQRQHGHCLRDDRRGAGLSREALLAGQRFARAQDAFSGRLARRWSSPPATKARTARFAACTRSLPPTRKNISIPDQYSNPANWQAHYRATANEIWEQTGGRITHFVAGSGTSGTFVGTTRRLKELNPAIRCISLQPDASFHGLEGWKHMQTAIRPAIYDDTLADENLEVGTEESYRLVKRIAREEGLLVSPSAAAALLGCFQVAKQIGPRRAARRDGHGFRGFRRKVSERTILG